MASRWPAARRLPRGPPRGHAVAAEGSAERSSSHDRPEWWGGERTFGGMVVAQALSAATQTVAEDLDIHSLHGYFLRPSRPGTRPRHTVAATSRRAVIQHERGRLRGRRGARPFAWRARFIGPRRVTSTSCRWPATSRCPRRRSSKESPTHRPSPSMSGICGATERRQDGTYLSTRRCWFRTRRRLSDDPAIHAVRAGVSVGHDGCRVPAAQPRFVGRLHRRQPRSRPLVPPAPAGR